MKRRVTTFVASCVLALALFGEAMAGSLEDGEAAYQRRDYETAVRLWRLAGDEGNVYAQFNLGLLYSSGQGVPQDYAQALMWFRKAADQGADHAQVYLGGMYHDGQGVPQDYVRAHMWFNLVASGASDAFDASTRDQAVRGRNEVAAKMTPAQIAEAQRLASGWAAKK